MGRVERGSGAVSQLVQAVHTIATLCFIAGSALVGVRLLLLARRTRQSPERLLGGAILGTAVLGYGLLIASLVARGGPSAMLAAGPVPPVAIVLTGAGKIFHDAGVTLFLLFALTVFRPGDRIARALFVGALGLLWGGLVAGALGGSFRAERVGGAAWLCEYLVIWSYPIWMMVESYRYWGMLRRREALGLADPVVANRVWLWGTGSLFTALAIWIASVPYALLGHPELLEATTPWVRIATALAGVASISCSYLAFVPPAWYLRRVRARRPALAPAA
jgi:hypothetical protein